MDFAVDELSINTNSKKTSMNYLWFQEDCFSGMGGLGYPFGVTLFDSLIKNNAFYTQKNSSVAINYIFLHIFGWLYINLIT